MNIPRCPNENCSALMVPLTQTFAEFEPVTWVCNFCKQWEVDEDAIRHNQNEFLRRRQTIGGGLNPDKIVDGGAS